MRIASGIDLLINKSLFRVRADGLQFRHAVNYIDGQSEPIDFVFDRQFHRRVDVAALFIAAHVQVLVICPAVREPVNQPWVAMEVENDWFIRSEQTI